MSNRTWSLNGKTKDFRAFIVPGFLNKIVGENGKRLRLIQVFGSDCYNDQTTYFEQVFPDKKCLSNVYNESRNNLSTIQP